MIAALCKHSHLDPNARGTAQRVREATEAIGAPVTDETIRGFLKEIPDALENLNEVDNSQFGIHFSYFAIGEMSNR